MEPTIGVNNWGDLLLGAAAVITALSLAYGQWKMARKVTEIDHAVNGKKAGAMPMVDQVDDLHSDRPPPPELPPELNDAAIRDMLKLLVADMHDRRK